MWIIESRPQMGPDVYTYGNRVFLFRGCANDMRLLMTVSISDHLGAMSWVMERAASYTQVGILCILDADVLITNPMLFRSLLGPSWSSSLRSLLLMLSSFSAVSTKGHCG